MTETKLWKWLTTLLVLGAVPMLIYEPARCGGSFLLALAACCLAEREFVRRSAASRLAKTVARLGRVLFLAFLVSFAAVQGIIAQGAGQDPRAENADVVLVLGARTYEDGRPSAALAARLDTAKDFLDKHPHTIAVLCGGQGANEPYEEAKAMRNYLTERGISEERLLLDDTSSNTIENIQNAKELLDRRGGIDTAAVITNDFHLARARKLMEHAGLGHLGIPAPTPNLLCRAAMHMREYGSIMGLMLTGRW